MAFLLEAYLACFRTTNIYDNVEHSTTLNNHFMIGHL